MSINIEDKTAETNLFSSLILTWSSFFKSSLLFSALTKNQAAEMARLRPDSKCGNAAKQGWHVPKKLLHAWRLFSKTPRFFVEWDLNGMVRAFSYTHPVCGCNRDGEKKCTPGSASKKKASDQLSKPIRMKPLHLCTKPVSGPLCFGASLALALAVGVLAIIRIEIRSNSRFSLARDWAICALKSQQNV